MSHYTRLKTHMVSAEHLVRALRDMGFKDVEIHETPQQLMGYEGSYREDRAQVIVRKKYLGPASNDMGFRKDEEGRFVAVISDYDRGAYGSSWLKSLYQRYAYHVAHDKLGQQNFDVVSEETQDDGTVRLVLRRMI